MNTRYPKSVIQKVIELHLRIMYENAPDNTSLDDLFRENSVEIANNFAKHAEGNHNDELSEEQFTELFREFDKWWEGFIVKIHIAVMDDLNFVRAEQSDLIGNVLITEEGIE